ncbi:MAG: hypothetical protein MJ252_03595, partial [archaeon]|nr:hypothetical protein [archaeon]
IIKKNKEDKIKIRNMKGSELEEITSYYASDLYSCFENILNVLSGDFKGSLMFQIVKLIFDQLMLLIRESEKEIEEFKNIEDITVVCIYAQDASTCLNSFKPFKKKVKALIPKDLYDHIKMRYIKGNPSVLGLFSNNIKKGCSKVIQLMFIEFRKNFLKLLFTTEWNEEVLDGIFDNFQSYFDEHFIKIFNNESSQDNLLILVKCFIESFVNYYMEELIHSVRTLNYKLLKQDKDNSSLYYYKLQFIKEEPQSIIEKVKNIGKDSNKKEDDPLNDKEEEVMEVVDLKKKIEKEKKGDKKDKPPKKKFKDEALKIERKEIRQKIEDDKISFNNFLNKFRSDAVKPFSMKFEHTLGKNYIETFVNKFDTVLNIITLEQSGENLKSKITPFKETYAGEFSKALLESLLYLREDYEKVTEKQLKMFYMALIGGGPQS